MADQDDPIIDSDETEGPAEQTVSLITLDERPPEHLLIGVLPHVVFFPGMLAPVSLEDDRRRAVVEHAWNQNRFVGFIAAKRAPEKGNPIRTRDLHTVGVAAKILRLMKTPNGNAGALLQIVARMRLKRFLRTKPMLIAEVTYPEEEYGEALRTEALLTRTKETLGELLTLMPGIPAEFNFAALNIEEAGRLADFLAANFEMKPEQRQELLEAHNVTDRLEKVLLYLTGELEVRRLGKSIQEEIRDKIEKNQKEFFLREQLKVIRRELGDEVDEKESVRDDYEERIAKAGLPEEAEERARRELGRLKVLTPEAAEYNVLKTYLDWLVDLPWSTRTEDKHDIARAERILDHDHYGLNDVKDRILEYLAVHKLKPDQRGAILCLAGPPGVGKTSLGRSIARSLGRNFFRFSLGGMRDEAEVKGHRRTYVGAMPGKILQGLRRAGSRNPLFMLDEIDKLGNDWRGDPSSAMLEVLDPEQNNDFLDHYLDVRFDLSDVMFICTANVKGNIPAPLLDRMEVIDLPGYIADEKYHIARKYLLPRQRERHGLAPKQVRISRAAHFEVIRGYTREAGVRNLERELARICRKTAAKVARGDTAGSNVTRANLTDFLGPRRHFGEVVQRAEQPGVAVGLAWTPFGGDVLFIEAGRMPGKGALQLTGKLGEVMNESARIAASYVRGHAEEFGVDPERFEKNDIHVHFPAGAIPKDGPSAGVTITTALISLLAGDKGRRIKPRLAMTGELSLTGKVLPVGGIRDKVIAARQAGVREVILPALNKNDIQEIPEHVQKGLTFHFVESYPEVFALAFPAS